MKSNYKPIGDYIKLLDNRNKDSKITLLRGVSTKKKLIESKANMTNVSLHNYKVLEKGQLVYVADTSRRGDKIAVALNDEATCIVSSIYTTFEVDPNYLLPEYLFMWFNRKEFDRYARFHSWGSARETFDWEDMCNVRIPIPDVEEQAKYVALYKGILANQKCYESSFDDLQLICDTYIENLIQTEKPKVLGNYIERTERRNSDSENTDVRGMSTKKKFRVPNSRVNYKRLSNYRVIKNREFVYVPTTDTWRCLAVALSDYDYDIVVSPIYISFRVKDVEKLLPEYLFLYMKREEFDRYARFHSWGSARENFNWEDMCHVKLPIPSIEVQKAIVTIYHTLETRKTINKQLKDSIKPLCPVLMRGVVGEMESVILK